MVELIKTVCGAPAVVPSGWKTWSWTALVVTVPSELEFVLLIDAVQTYASPTFSGPAHDLPVAIP